MDDVKQVITRFIKNNSEMITACFDEYYFIIPEGVIKPDVSKARNFHVGDELPIKGETYVFPENFNVIDLHFKKVAQIRDGRLNDLISIDEYFYDALPAFNMMGFWINLTSQEDFEEFKKDFKCFSLVEREKLAAFANKWFDIIRNRKVRYK